MKPLHSHDPVYITHGKHGGQSGQVCAVWGRPEHQVNIQVKLESGRTRWIRPDKVIYATPFEAAVRKVQRQLNRG